MKKVLYYVAGIFLVFAISFFGYKHLHTQEMRVDGKLKLYSLQELEEKSTLIVKASLLNKLSTDISFDSDKVPYDYKTYSNLIVEKVYQDKGKLIQKGDRLKVLEWYAEWRDFAGSYRIISGEEYVPLKSNQDYILFLYNEPGKDYYEIIGLHQGKYSFDKSVSENGTLSTNNLSLLEINEYDKNYIDKYKQVFNKYK